ncbi:hypothetical protein [Pelagicoccus mobilis]|uniref:hypothetical protein n=1 Tax=Pelagicoccus mobilis TaxID=415221 RepID=UPI0036705C8F
MEKINRYEQAWDGAQALLFFGSSPNALEENPTVGVPPLGGNPKQRKPISPLKREHQQSNLKQQSTGFGDEPFL